MGRAQIAIIGVGNYLMGDEGVGIHAAKKLSEISWPNGAQIIDGGTPGVSLIHLIEGRRLAIIIDCADFGGKAGEIRIFNPDDLRHDERACVSLHATDLLTVLELARCTGRYPDKVLIVGIQPEKIEVSIKLSAAIQRALDGLYEIIALEIQGPYSNKLQNLCGSF